MKILNIGFGNYLIMDRVIAILNPDSAPMKRLREDAKSKSKLIDGTHGRRTRSMILMDSDQLILSGIQPETLSQRLLSKKALSDQS